MLSRPYVLCSSRARARAVGECVCDKKSRRYRNVVGEQVYCACNYTREERSRQRESWREIAN